MKLLITLFTAILSLIPHVVVCGLWGLGAAIFFGTSKLAVFITVVATVGLLMQVVPTLVYSFVLGMAQDD